MAEAAISVEGVTHAIGGKTILRDVSLGFARDRVNVLLGPNGAGKSTLLKIAAGRVRPSEGRILYGDADVAGFGAAALARRRAFLSQQIEVGFPITAEAVVMMGRYPFFHRVPGAVDHRIVGEVLDQVGMAAFRKRIFPTLSGGEQQRIHLARVLAQIARADAAAEDRILFLDEPLGGLDIQHQLQIIATVRALARDRCTVVMTLHDLNLAIESADELFFLRDGAVVRANVSPMEIDAGLIRAVFDVEADLLTESGGSRAFRFRSS